MRAPRWFRTTPSCGTTVNRSGRAGPTLCVRTALLVAGTMSVATACGLPPPGAGEPLGAAVALSDPVLVRPSVCQGYVALSFDDGPTSGTTRLLEVLDKYDLPALFFNTGERTLREAEAMAAETALAGVQLGNHSFSHPDLSALSPDEVRDEIERTRTVQGSEVTFFRPPFGSANQMVVDVVTEMGMQQVLWTHDSKDFEATSVDQIVAQSAGMNDGGILLLHDGNAMTVRALPRIVDSYYVRGLCFGQVASSSLAQAPAESPALTFYARAVAP